MATSTLVDLTRKRIIELAERSRGTSTAKRFALIDDEHQQYGLIVAGWEKAKRVSGITLLVTIEEDRVFIHHDGTMPGFADYLIENGVPPDKIVLAFYREPFTADLAA